MDIYIYIQYIIYHYYDTIKFIRLDIRKIYTSIFICVYYTCVSYVFLDFVKSQSFRATTSQLHSGGRLAAPIHQPWPLDAMCFSGFRLAVAATGPSCTFISLIDVPRKFWVKRVKRGVLVVEVGFTEANRLFLFFLGAHSG